MCDNWPTLSLGHRERPWSTNHRSFTETSLAYKQSLRRRITFELLLPCTAQSLGSLVSHAARPDSPVAWVWLVPAKLYLISALGKPRPLTFHTQLTLPIGVLNSRTSLRRPVPGRSSSCHKRDDSAKGQSDPLAEIRTFPLDEHTVITKSADFEAVSDGSTIMTVAQSSRGYTIYSSLPTPLADIPACPSADPRLSFSHNAHPRDTTGRPTRPSLTL